MALRAFGMVSRYMITRRVAVTMQIMPVFNDVLMSKETAICPV
jgi:hypothetical protein